MAITYPYRTFRYSVEVEGLTVGGFSEVSGIDSTVDVIEYREGDDLYNTPRKLTGLTKFGNVTLKWGSTGTNGFLDWIYSVAPKNAAPPTGMVRHNVTIKLINDAGSPGPQWVLKNAWPVRYSVPDLNALGTEVAIETLELCCEGIEMTNSGTSNTASAN